MNPAQEAIAKALGWGWHRHTNHFWGHHEHVPASPLAGHDILAIDDLPDSHRNTREEEQWQADHDLQVVPAPDVDHVGASRQTSVSLMLLGFMLFLMALIYFVNFPDPDIQGSTWKLLSTTMSIFIAALVFSATQEAIAYWVEDGEPHHGHEIGHGSHVNREILLVSFARLLAFWIALQLLIFHEKRSFVELEGLGILGGHVAAFACMDAFGTLQAAGPFSSSWSHNLGAVAFSSCVLLLVFQIAAAMRSALFPVSRRREAIDDWINECRMVEHEIAGMVIGLAIAQSIRFAITGHHLSPIGADLSDDFLSKASLLLAAVLCAAGLIAPLELFLSSWRVILLVRMALSMTMAWCFLFFAQLYFWKSAHEADFDYGTRMTALLTAALVVSLFCFVAIFLVNKFDYFGNEHVRWSSIATILNALAFVMGLSWEHVFHSAVEGIGDLRYIPVNLAMNTIIIFGVLSVVVFPAWWCMILPRALKQRSGRYKSANPVLD